MRSKSPVKQMFDKRGSFKIHDEEVPGGKFNNYVPKDKNFRTNNPLLDNDVADEIPDQNEWKPRPRSGSPSRPQRTQPREPRQ